MCGGVSPDGSRHRRPERVAVVAQLGRNQPSGDPQCSGGESRIQSGAVTDAGARSQACATSSSTTAGERDGRRQTAPWHRVVLLNACAPAHAELRPGRCGGERVAPVLGLDPDHAGGRPAQSRRRRCSRLAASPRAGDLSGRARPTPRMASAGRVLPTDGADQATKLSQRRRQQGPQLARGRPTGLRRRARRP